MDDATVIALAAVRLAVKNLIIVRALRDHVDYDDDWYLAAIAQQFEALAGEKGDDAVRVHAAIADAQTKRGRGKHPSDYRPVDVSTLTRRELTVRALAERLRAIGADQTTAQHLLADARHNALDEIAANIHFQLTRSFSGMPQLTDPESAAALADLSRHLDSELRLSSP